MNLREMEIGDMELYKKWLYRPHVAMWYHHPLDWIEEIEKQESEFKWIHHFIVLEHENPIGFCQYYACENSDELWEGYTKLGGTYSIDYLIGETDYLGKGFGKQIVEALIKKVQLHNDAKRIVVQPEKENKASCGVLISCGFILDKEKEIYVRKLGAPHIVN